MHLAVARRGAGHSELSGKRVSISSHFWILFRGGVFVCCIVV